MMNLDLSQSHSTDIYFECRCGGAWNREHQCKVDSGIEVSETVVMDTARWFWKYGLSGIWSEWLLDIYSIKGRYIDTNKISSISN